MLAHICIGQLLHLLTAISIEVAEVCVYVHRRVFRETGKLLVVFVMGSVATIVGTLAAAKLFPLVALGQDAWKVAAALCARHIGVTAPRLPTMIQEIPSNATLILPTCKYAGLCQKL